MFDVPDAPWIGHCKEDYEERSNPYYDWEERADYEADKADRRWKEMQEEEE